MIMIRFITTLIINIKKIEKMSIVTDKPLIPRVKKSISIEIEDKGIVYRLCIDQQKIIEDKEKEIRKLQIKI